MERKIAELLRAGKFALVGVANTLVDFGVFFLLTNLAGVSVYPAQAAGYCAGVVNSYVLNRSWTFRSRERFFGPTLARFLLLSGAMILFSTGVMYLCYDLAGLPRLVSKVIVTAAVMVVNFGVSRFWVFSVE